MLKIAVMVRVLPIPIKSRQLQKMTTSHTALTGVPVYELTLLQKLCIVSSDIIAPIGGGHLPREWEGCIAGKGPSHSRVGQHGRTAGEELDQHDEEPHDGSTCSATGIKEDLGDGKTSRCRHNLVVV